SPFRDDGREVELDSRPSDAISLAIRADAPIFAADRVIEESAIEFEGDDVDQEVLEAEGAKFKSFLDEVTAEDFAVESEDEEEESSLQIQDREGARGRVEECMYEHSGQD